MKTPLLLAGLLATQLVFNTQRLLADERDEKLKELEKRLESYEQKTRRLEEKIEALEGRGAETRTAQPTLSFGQSGFTMRSAENDFVVSLHGILQLDSRTYFDDGGILGNDGFVLRRLRPIFEGTVFRDFNFRLQPDVGGSNGLGDDRMSTGVDFDDSKDVAGRLFFHPFLTSSLKPVKRLGVGIGGSIGDQHGAAGLPQNNGFATEGQQQFFTYRTSTTATNANVIADGTHWRVSPQSYWYWNRFGLLGEYAISSQRLRRTDVGTPGSVRNTAWQITGSCTLTGETPTYKRLLPDRTFDPRNNSWGAFEVVGR